MRVLAVSSDRSKRGVLFPDSSAFERQEAYATVLGDLDVIGFSLVSDAARENRAEHLRVVPTNSASKLLYAYDALRIAKRLPQPDVVSAQDPFETGFIAWLIARHVRAPLHVQVHTDFLSPAYAKLSLLNRLRVMIAGFVLRRAVRVRVVSPRIKASIEKRYTLNAPITVLPIFVDVSKHERAQGVSAHEGMTLLVVARDAPEKNITLAVESFKKTAPKNSRLIVCTNAKDRHVDPRIQFVDSEAIQLYKEADLVLVPSKYEGYGLVIVEALAGGVPVLATDVGIAREAGATVTTEEHFADALADWFKSGPRTGQLKYHPYQSFEEYVQKYVGDIASCAGTQKSQ